MTPAASTPALIDRLPPVRGRYAADAPIAQMTWFRLGGPAEVLFRPADAADLAEFLAGKPADVPVTVLGVSSNTLVRDGGIPGVVVRLGGPFARTRMEGAEVEAGAGCLALNVSLAAAEAGVGGLEFLSGIPGTVGGALRMNAGAYGGETADVVVHADLLDPKGEAHRLGVGSLGFRYRGCAVPDDWIFVGARLAGRWDEVEAVTARMTEIQRRREESQPLRTRTGGSTFRNPDDPASGGAKAWELIDRAGCRGLRIGGAQVSDKHCNFIIAHDGATAADVEMLGEEVRRRVHDTSGVTLQWEIRRMGVPAPGTPPVRPVGPVGPVGGDGR